MVNWDIKKLGDVATIIVGFSFKSQFFNQNGEGIRLVRGKNITHRELRWGNDTRWWNDFSINFEKYYLKDKDIVIGMDGSLVGKNYAQISNEDLPLLLVQRVACIRAKQGVSQSYIWSCIANLKFENYVDAVKTGTSIPHISSKQISDYEISLPPLPTQKKIASILSSLDDKIEINTRMNKVLEEIARALFHQWFVEFEFPDAEGRPYKSSGGKMVESEMGFVPEGWEVKSLDQIADFMNGIACQKYPPSEDENSMAVIKIKELRSGNLGEADRVSPSIPGKYYVKNGDVLFSWSGSLMVDIWTSGEGVLNQHLFKVTSDKYQKWFYYFWIKHHLSEFQNIAADKATTMGHIQRKHLENAKVVVPDKATLCQMDLIMNPIVEKIIQNNLEVNCLSELRDTLLPKLMNGEIEV